MIGYVLDTDHASLHERSHPPLAERLTVVPAAEVTLTIITAEELLRGRLAVIRQSDDRSRVRSYTKLNETIQFLRRVVILHFDDRSDQIYRDLRAQRIRIGTQDLKITTIALANNVTLLTRNFADFRRILDLRIEDWSA